MSAASVLSLMPSVLKARVVSTRGVVRNVVTLYLQTLDVKTNWESTQKLNNVVKYQNKNKSSLDANGKKTALKSEKVLVTVMFRRKYKQTK